MQYRCLACKHIWNYEGSKEPRQCTKCRSYDIIPEEEYQRIKQKCLEIEEDNPRLRLAILRVILMERGFKFQPLSTLNLVEAILDDVFPQMEVGATILPDGRIFYHKKRVKRRE